MTNQSQATHRLLCFAHRGEAKAFLQEFSWQAQIDQEHLYHLKKSDEALSLVLTGEGSDSTLINLTQAIVTLREKYPDREIEVINLGVCGALKEHPNNFKVNEVIEVSTCYAQDQFKSFSPQKASGHFETASLISTNQRVLDEVTSLKLSHFAPLVDREAWAVGRVCHELNSSFLAIKVISDFADGDICARVKEDTETWSDSLLRAFLKLGKTKNSDLQRTLKEALPELHITLSQERKLKQLIKALELKGYDLSSALKKVNYQELIEKDIRPKDKTKELTTVFQELLNPLEKKLRSRLALNTAKLEEAGFQVSFDQGLEQERVNLSISLESEVQINKIIAALESYNLNELRNILRGKEP